MNMKTVIRVEHPFDNKGLFRTRAPLSLMDHSKFKKISDRHADSTRFPTPWNDYELLNNLREKRPGPTHDNVYDCIFAFHSVDQLSSALTSDELKECLNKLGFKVLKMTVKDCVESTHQVMFKREDVVKTEDITSVFA